MAHLYKQTLTVMMVCLRTNISEHNKPTSHADHYIIYYNME